MARTPYATATLLPGAFIPPRTGGTYPLDLDASLRYTRPAHGFTLYPYPSVIGCISGLYPQQDHLVQAGRYGKTPSGPWINNAQIANAGAIFASQNTTVLSDRSLRKVTG